MEKRKIICSFDKAQYLLGENVRIHTPAAMSGAVVTLLRLERAAPCDVRREEGSLLLLSPTEGSYGIRLETEEAWWEGAFDVAAERRQVTRYGFLSDFSPGDGGADDVLWMRDLHLNAVQFYDWMYRHDELLPEGEREEYQDPLGRDTSLSVIREKVERCRACGMRPFAYGAVYAATPEMFRQHPQWGMYTMDGKPMMFAGWLHFMNIAADCGWTEHLLEQYRRVIRFGFSGIHMDTYGFPKRVWDAHRRPVDLSGEFAGLIGRAAHAVTEVDGSAGVIFNAVNNWPVETVADAPQDAVYIEVWPPNDAYCDLYRLIREARLCSGKPVVLAAYMRPFMEADVPGAERALRLAWAAISASGGTQLVFGEGCGALRDSYYVNYAHLRKEFLPVIQRYCDFLVRYADLLYNDSGMDTGRTASGGINEDIIFQSGSRRFSPDGTADTIWTILRESAARITIHLLNLLGNNAAWNEAKNEPPQVDGICLRLRLDRPVRGIYCASPDGESLEARPLPFSYEVTEQGRIYSAELSGLTFWKTVWVELED